MEHQNLLEGVAPASLPSQGRIMMMGTVLSHLSMYGQNRFALICSTDKKNLALCVQPCCEGGFSWEVAISPHTFVFFIKKKNVHHFREVMNRRGLFPQVINNC